MSAKLRQASPERAIPSPLPLYKLPAEAKVPKTGCPQRPSRLRVVRHLHSSPSEPEPILIQDNDEDNDDGDEGAGDDALAMSVSTTVYSYYEPALVHSEGSSTLVFDSVFESGNLLRADRVRYPNDPTRDEAYHEYELYVHPDINNSAYRQWFYFQVTNMAPDVEYRFALVNLAKSGALYQTGLQPVVYSEAAARDRGEGWVHGGFKVSYVASDRAEGSNTLSFSYTFAAAGDTVYFACIAPYTYTDLQEYLDRLEADPERSLVCRRTDLCQTLAGNSCDLLTITSPTKEGGLPLDARRVIVISARVHPGESNSSFMMKGILDYLTGNSLGALVLRRHFIFKVAPMLNPDGVINGNTRVSLAGWDLNRKWAYPVEKLFPTIYHLKRLITSLQRPQPSGPPRVAIYCDLHGHSIQRNIFTYGCFKTGRRGKAQLKMHAKDDPRVFPMIVAKQSDLFSFAHCNFKVQNSKLNTARVVVHQELGVVNSYTLEASFCGPDFGPKKDTQMSIADLESMGASWCQSLLVYYELGYCVDEAARPAPLPSVVAPQLDDTEGLNAPAISWDLALLNDCESMLDELTKQHDDDDADDVDSDVSDAAQEPIPPNNEPELYRPKKAKTRKTRKKKKMKGKKKPKKRKKLLLQGTNGGIVVPVISIPLPGALTRHDVKDENKLLLDLTAIDTPTSVYSHFKKPGLSRPSSGGSISSSSPKFSLESCVGTLMIRPKLALSSMGAAASNGAAAVAAPVVQNGRKVIRTKLRRKDLFVFQGVAEAPTSKLMEMNADILRDAERFEELEKVDFLETDVEGFQRTASARRKLSEGPTPLPTDKTWASNSMTLVTNEPGRFTDQQFRDLLRAYRENPTPTTIEALAAKYGTDPGVIHNILRHCSVIPFIESHLSLPCRLRFANRNGRCEVGFALYLRLFQSQRHSSSMTARSLSAPRSGQTPSRSQRGRPSTALMYITNRFTDDGGEDEYDENDVIGRASSGRALQRRQKSTMRSYRGWPKWKARVRRFMDEPTSSVAAQLYNYFMIINIMGNFMPWMIETMDGPNHVPGDPGSCTTCQYPHLLRAKTYFLWDLGYTVLFTIEFIVRWVHCKSHFLFWRRPRTILDAAALVPSYLLIYNKYLDHPKSRYQPYLNMLRMGRNVRIALMLRDMPGIRVLAITTQQCIAPLQVTGFFLLTIVMMFATALYYAEPCYDVDTCKFTDVFNAGYFIMVTYVDGSKEDAAVGNDRVATVGYGDQTVDINNILAVLIDINAMLFGTLYLAMPFAIIGVRYQVAWHRHEIQTRNGPRQPSKTNISIRPVPSVTLHSYAHRATRHYLDLCTDFATLCTQINALLLFPPHEVVTGQHRKQHHDLLVDIIDNAKMVMVCFHHNLQDINAFEPKQRIKPAPSRGEKPARMRKHALASVLRAEGYRRARDKILKSVMHLEKQGSTKLVGLELGSWRHRLSLLLEKPQATRTGQALHRIFFVLALSSVLLFYAQTTPEFQSYGPLSPLCQRAFATYCSGADAVTDPGCFALSPEGGLRSPVTALRFDCANPVPAAELNTTTCFGQGPNYSAGNVGCVSLFADARLCKLRQCQPGHVPTFDLTLEWFYFEVFFGVAFTVEIFLRYAVAVDTSAFLRRPDTVIDLVSIFPFYAEALAGAVEGQVPIYAVVPTFPTARSLLPIIKTLRILKITRVRLISCGGVATDRLVQHFKATTVLAQTALLSWRRLLIPLFFLFLSCIATAALFYEIERGTQCFVSVNCTWWNRQLWTTELSAGLPRYKREQIQISQFTIITDMLQSTYYSIVTFTTVGYGDLRVRTPFGKILDILVMIFGSCYTAMPLSLVGGQFYACYELFLLNQSGEEAADGEQGPREDHIPKHLVLSPDEVATLKSCSVLVMILDEMIQNIYKLNDLTPHATFLESAPKEGRHMQRSGTMVSTFNVLKGNGIVRRRASVGQHIARVLPGRRSNVGMYEPSDAARAREYEALRHRVAEASQLMTTIYFQFTSLVEKVAEATHSETYTNC
ncbi:metalloprotease family M14B [Achlya hypogyna]|uniref:Metalloprotease family M14B n=1 Tax=Achlya hypogyna TaxID=1202772 RepID=A0A1V9ZMR3_ACHHY|nr:metalloprotease family M14B [Achlya hypogyna]